MPSEPISNARWWLVIKLIHILLRVAPDGTARTKLVTCLYVWAVEMRVSR